MLAQDGADNHLDIRREGVVLEVVEVDSDLVGIDNRVVILLRISDGRKQFLLVAVFETCRACYSGTELEYLAVFTL